MINRADKAALVPVQKVHSLAGIYTGVYNKIIKSARYPIIFPLSLSTSEVSEIDVYTDQNPEFF